MPEATLYKIFGDRIEKMDEAMQELTPTDNGREFYKRASNLYRIVTLDGDAEAFEELSKMLYSVTGYRI